MQTTPLPTLHKLLIACDGYPAASVPWPQIQKATGGGLATLHRVRTGIVWVNLTPEGRQALRALEAENPVTVWKM